MTDRELEAAGWVIYESYYVAGSLCKCGKKTPKLYPWPNRAIPAYPMIPDVCPRCGTLQKDFKEVALLRRNWRYPKPWWKFWEPEEKTATFEVKGGKA